MRTPLLALAAAAVALCGCATSPKRTVLNLDTTDPKWTSQRCVAARKAVHRYSDHEGARGALGLLGNLAAPLAGTAASAAVGMGQTGERKRLNRQVDAACVTHRRAARR